MPTPADTGIAAARDEDAARVTVDDRFDALRDAQNRQTAAISAADELRRAHDHIAKAKLWRPGGTMRDGHLSYDHLNLTQLIRTLEEDRHAAGVEIQRITARIKRQLAAPSTC